MTFQDYAAQACQDLQNHQNAFLGKYGVNDYKHWFYNQSGEYFRLYNNEEEEIYFKYLPVGSFSRKSNTWMWSWANQHSYHPGRFRILEIKNFGLEHGYKELTEEAIKGDEYTGWELTSIAFQLLGGTGTYRVVVDELEIYFLFIEVMDRQEIDNIGNALIECSSHGKMRLAFVCQHLNGHSSVGFHEAFETFKGMPLNKEEDFQAWCNTCEHERIKTNGWNDESMEFANIRLVCEECYFNMKALNK